MGIEYHETVFSHDVYMDDGKFCVDAAEEWSIKMVKRLKADFPNEVDIKHENKDGSIYAYMPLKWMRITPRKKKVLSDEQKRALAERLTAARRRKISS